MQVMIRTLVILKDVTVLQSGGGANSNSSVTTEPLDLQCARHAGDCFSVCLSLASWALREAFTDDLTVTGVSAFLQKGKEMDGFQLCRVTAADALEWALFANSWEVLGWGQVTGDLQVSRDISQHPPPPPQKPASMVALLCGLEKAGDLAGLEWSLTRGSRGGGRSKYKSLGVHSAKSEFSFSSLKGGLASHPACSFESFPHCPSHILLHIQGGEGRRGGRPSLQTLPSLWCTFPSDSAHTQGHRCGNGPGCVPLAGRGQSASTAAPTDSWVRCTLRAQRERGRVSLLVRGWRRRPARQSAQERQF